jgi:glycosyltransferase involved in cell wall biosynthesis
MGLAAIRSRRVIGDNFSIPSDASKLESSETFRLKILTFLETLDPGGVERVALRLCSAWQNLGHEIVLVLGNRRGQLVAELPETIRVLTPRSPATNYLAFSWHVINVVRTEKPDIIYCAGNYYSAIAVWLRLRLGKACPPIVCKISNALVRYDYNAVQQWFYSHWLRFHCRYIDHFVAISPGLKQEFCEVAHCPADRISVIYDPYVRRADTTADPLLQSYIDSDVPLILGVGRLTPQKDFGLLVRAFRQVLDTCDARLVILGDGPERRKLESLAKSLGIADRVQLPGHSNCVDQWMVAASIFALTSRFEGLPAVVIESLAAGAPVVATDCCTSLIDVLSRPALGRIVPRGDAKIFARALLEQLETASDPAELQASVTSYYSNQSADSHLTLFAAIQKRQKHFGLETKN